MNSQPLSITKERSRLHDSVNITTEPSNITVKIGNNKCILYFCNFNICNLTTIYLIGGREITIPENTPWFTKWRTTFLQIQNVSDHEYTKHFLGCILYRTMLNCLIKSMSMFNSIHFWSNNFLTNLKSGMIVISSSDEEKVASLTQQVQQSILPNQNQSPKWFHTTILRYYVVLHESLNPDLSM